jgi:hypothetical protein
MDMLHPARFSFISASVHVIWSLLIEESFKYMFRRYLSNKTFTRILEKNTDLIKFEISFQCDPDFYIKLCVVGQCMKYILCETCCPFPTMRIQNGFWRHHCIKEIKVFFLLKLKLLKFPSYPDMIITNI